MKTKSPAPDIAGRDFYSVCHEIRDIVRKDNNYKHMSDTELKGHVLSHFPKLSHGDQERVCTIVDVSLYYV